jgi:hypothetical protein
MTGDWRAFQLVVKMLLEISPTRCQAIRSIKVLHCFGTQQLGRYKVPAPAGVRCHPQNERSPIFFGPMIHDGRSMLTSGI